MMVARPSFLSLVLALTLSVLLALGSVGMASARAQAAGVTEMVICAGGQMGTVTLDAKGNPVDHPHRCPDCAPGAMALPLSPAPAGRPAARRARRQAPRPRHGPHRQPLAPMARGPPVPV